MMNGKFFVFEGLDGSGKSTQAQIFAEWLRQVGHTVVTCRDPGTTEVGERLRDVLLRRSEIPLAPVTETLLYMTARAQLVAEVIRPALAESKVVVADRFLLSNIVYQGYGLGLAVQELWDIGSFATQGLVPDLQFVLDLPWEAAVQRLPMTRDRLESRQSQFFDRVRAGYLTEASRDPDHILVIDAQADVDTIQSCIRESAIRSINASQADRFGRGGAAK